MAAEIRVPEMGESVIEATVGRWLKQEGQPVAAGEVLVELETDKVNAEVAADRTGVLERILHAAGDTVHPGDALALIAEGEGTAASSAATPLAATSPAAAPPAAAVTAALHATPIAQRMADARGLDLAAIRGTGPGGRIVKEDVEHATQPGTALAAEPPATRPLTPSSSAPSPAISAAVSSSSPASGSSPHTAPSPSPVAVPSPSAPELSAAAELRAETRQRLSRRRLTIARRLVEAQHTAAMLTTFNEIDMSAVVTLRAKQRAAFKERHGVDLGYMSFFTKAAVGALQLFPRVNAELQGEELILKHYRDIGVAIGDPEGLVVPVLRDAQRMTFADIERAIAGFVEKARTHALTLEDLRGGTFTITNGGVYGSLMSTPILNPPQVAILGLHRIEQRPVAVEGQAVIRPMMYVALSYDHRVVDGREAVQFLARIKQLVEQPELLLLDS
ncbi:MAG: 2-oxoglutarate dehydrogenase complex dihydrolipoyllysine-residue succinyltransferase [Chloroflexota bacterium]